MKKLLMFLAFATTLLTSCGSCETTIARKESIERIDGIPMAEYVYDGCQYVCFRSETTAAWDSHKGNCNNPIHSQFTAEQLQQIKQVLEKE